MSPLKVGNTQMCTSIRVRDFEHALKCLHISGKVALMAPRYSVRPADSQVVDSNPGRGVRNPVEVNRPIPPSVQRTRDTATTLFHGWQAAIPETTRAASHFARAERQRGCCKYRKTEASSMHCGSGSLVNWPARSVCCGGGGAV